MSEVPMYDIYEGFYSTIEKSVAFSKYCEAVYGIDLSQDGFSDLLQINDLIDKLRLKPGSKLLDIGCGNGKFCEYVRNKTKADVYGFDSLPSQFPRQKKDSVRTRRIFPYRT